MKKHSLKLEIALFCVIFATFILSPIITQFLKDYSNIFVSWTFPFDALICGFLAVLLCCFFMDKHSVKPVLYRVILPSTFCFCVLFCISLFMKFFSVIIPCQNGSEITNVSLPDSFITWFFCILRFLFAAFFEETLYRFYLPDFLRSLLKEDSKKVFYILIETGTALLFAAAHIYLGIFSVINAVLAHFVLRFTFKKTNSILPSFIAHFLYNIISLILL